MVVPAAEDYRPLAPGSGNRINILAAVGFLAVAAGLGGLLLGLVGRRLRPGWTGVLGLAAALVLGAGYVDRLHDDKAAWDRAFREEQRLMEVVRKEAPAPAPGGAIYLFGHQSQVAPGIATFGWVWDLNGVVKLMYGDPTLSGVPVLPGAAFVCDPGLMYPTVPGGGFGPYQGSPYKAVFVHVDGRTANVNTPEQCRAQVRRFLGPDALVAGPSG
jgi:hypothetical protein